jgi:addiction module RelE/StbE family toxin
MVKIVWTELSVDDLKEIHDYIAKNSQRFASITVDKIYQRAQLLTSSPSLGRMVPEIKNEKVRELIIGNYRLIYFIVSEFQIDILRVYHSARSLSDDTLK